MKSTLRINHLAVWLLALIDQGLSMTWFGLFANQWIAYLNKPMEEIENSDSPMPYLFGFINAVVLNYMVAWIFVRLEVKDVMAGLKYSFMFWLGFFFLPMFTNYLFSMRPVGLGLIDGGNYLLYFLVAGVVLSSWRKVSQA